MPIKPPLAPVAAEVRQDQESEAALIQRVKQSISKNNWTIGECASTWASRWAKGRTDEDFGAAVGMSGDQVYQRRRVWDRFGSSCFGQHPPVSFHTLLWSHFYAAVSWDDAAACLEWASVNQATVAEMKAWREQNRYVSESVTLGNSGNGAVSDPFGSDDPFGEGAEGTGTESGDGTEAGGTETEEDSTLPPGSGTEAQGGKQKPPQDEFLTLKAKTIKSAEMLMRLTGDLNEVHPFPQADAIRKAASKSIETIKGVK